MSISLLNNAPAMLAANQFARVSRAVNQSLERLSTGKRINRASDDPAGSIAVNNLKSQRAQVQAKMDALEFDAQYVGAREGARSVVSDLLVELNGHIVTAASSGGTSPEERRALQGQVDSLLQTIDHLALTSRFNNQQLLVGEQASQLGRTRRTVTSQDGTTRTIEVSLADLGSGRALNLETGDLEGAQEVVKALTTSYNEQRARLGARGQQIDSELEALSDQMVNLTDAQSKIEDVDYAQEVSALVRNQVLQQAAAFALRLAQNSGPQSVLALLKNLN